MKCVLNFLFVAISIFLATPTQGQDALDPELQPAPASQPDQTKQEVTQQAEKLDVKQLVKSAAHQLLAIQADDGAWPYEGVYRVKRRIPLGYRIGGSAIVCAALLTSELDEEERKLADAAITKSVELILKELREPLMQPTTKDAYDVRVWGHIYALDLFCRLEKTNRFGELCKQTDPWITDLIKAVEDQEIDGGGWNYANRRSHAAFVTAPAVHALLKAKKNGHQVDDAKINRAAEAMIGSRSKNGAFQYSGIGARSTAVPGAIARMALCETTLMMLDKGDPERLQASIDAFHEHWDELEKRRKKTGTHKPPYGIAPYYFYFGHRYVAQAISMLPKEKQQAEMERYEKAMLKTKDADNTWNDRVFDRSKAYGTAMVILSLTD